MLETTTFLQGGAKYYFSKVGKEGEIASYANASYGTTTGGDSLRMLQAGVGAEYYFTESVAPFVEADYTRFSTAGLSSNGYSVNLVIKLRF